MQNDSLKKTRDACVDELNTILDSTLPTIDPPPQWVMVMVSIPMFLWHWADMTLVLFMKGAGSVVKNLLGILKAPFVLVYYWVDITLIMLWFFSRVVRKLKGGKDDQTHR